MLPRIFALGVSLAGLVFTSSASAAEPLASRGAQMFQANCAACHQPTGVGIPAIFPPLAGSDYLMADKDRSIRIVLQGYSGRLVVNGTEYQGVMPPLGTLDDDIIADILTYVRSSFGNQGDAVLTADVQRVRAQLNSAEANAKDPYQPLPKVPEGFKLREVVRLPLNSIRLATMPGANWIMALTQGGDVLRIEPATGNVTRVLTAKTYYPQAVGKNECLGLTIDSERRLYLISNNQVRAEPYHLNRVVIFRSAPLDATGTPTDFKPWFQVDYPYGNSYFNHGVSKIEQGPDGLMYVSSGARTDGGEVDGGVAGKAAYYWKGGETEITAAIWRLDPKVDKPTLEVFARGIRNAFTFAWNDRNELFTATNGPDADMPEELDFVEKGKHYGFPYQFADKPVSEKPYPHTPEPPPGLQFVSAIRNFGPAGLGKDGKPMATFEPHSSPTSLIFLGPEWPAAYRGKFLMGRFGNMIQGKDSGYDMLLLSLKKNAEGIYEAHSETFIAPLARPADVLQVGKKLYILEYTRSISGSASGGLSPGRVLELSW